MILVVFVLFILLPLCGRKVRKINYIIFNTSYFAQCKSHWVSGVARFLLIWISANNNVYIFKFSIERVDNNANLLLCLQALYYRVVHHRTGRS